MDQRSDPSEARVVARIDPDLREIIPAFLDNRRQDIQRLENAIDRKDYEAVRRIGHRLKGDGSGYGFDEISVIGKLLEASAQAQNNRRMAAAKDRLARYLEQVTVLYSDEEA